MIEKQDTEIYFTPKQAADYFNLSLSTVKNYIYAGKLKTLKTPGGHHRIQKSELLVILGEKNAMAQDSAVNELSCTLLLNAFKLLGPAGTSFIIHSKRVAQLSYDLAKKIGCSDKEANQIRIAALLHDIGHIGVGKAILLKSGPLASEEYAIIKTHPGLAEELLNSAKEMKDIGGIIVQHHERVDGSGYPNGLSGNKIQKASCIISVAEAYDAMVSRHSYKNPVSIDMAIAELMQNRGSQFDAGIVEAFVKII